VQHVRRLLLQAPTGGTDEELVRRVTKQVLAALRKA